MSGLNKVMIIGRLGRDPEVKYTQSGSAVCHLNIATDESYTDREGNKVDRTEWHKVVAFNRVAENCGQYLNKGRLVFVEGKLATRKWQDQQGQDRYTTEIQAMTVQFLDRDAEGSSQGSQAGNQGGKRPPQRQPRRNDDGHEPAFPSEASGMDDVPF